MLPESQKGVALYLSLAILAILLGIGLGISAIVFGQLKTIRDIGFSTVAFYAADSGIERELFEKNYTTQSAGYTYACFIDLDNLTPVNCTNISVCPDNLPSGNFACTQVTVVNPSAPTKIRSVGYYSEVRRALEINF